MQDYTGLYRKSMHRDRPQKIRGWCNSRAEAKHHPNQVTSRDWMRHVTSVTWHENVKCE